MQEEAEAAVAALNLKPFRDRVLTVSISAPKKGKVHSTMVLQSGSPGPGTDENHLSNGDGKPSHPSSSAQTRRERTIALLNIPDTVNDARIRALVEPHGALKKIILRPDHQGAIIEFEHVQDLGKASMRLEGYEIAPGRKIRVGTVAEMFAQKADLRLDKLGDAAAAAKKKAKQDSAAAAEGGGMSSAPFAGARHISRPAQPGARRGGRGGLGLKRGGGGLGGSRAGDTPAAAAAATTTAGEGATAEGSGGKSNADFKALFLKGKEEQKSAEP